MEKIATKLTDSERELFQTIFYESETGIMLNDHETPCPYGCPWYFGYDVSLRGDDLDEMVENYIEDYLH